MEAALSLKPWWEPRLVPPEGAPTVAPAHLLLHGCDSIWAGDRAPFLLDNNFLEERRCRQPERFEPSLPPSPFC